MKDKKPVKGTELPPGEQSEAKQPKKGKQGGIKGMHKGHPYNPNCGCIVCTRETANRKRIAEIITPEIIAEYKKSFVDPLMNEFERSKERIEPESKEKIIQDFKDNLPKDTVIFELSEPVEDLISQKLNTLKRAFPGNYKTFVDGIINHALTTYLNSIPHE